MYSKRHSFSRQKSQTSILCFPPVSNGSRWTHGQPGCLSLRGSARKQFIGREGNCEGRETRNHLFFGLGYKVMSRWQTVPRALAVQWNESHDQITKLQCAFRKVFALISVTCTVAMGTVQWETSFFIETWRDDGLEANIPMSVHVRQPRH